MPAPPPTSADPPHTTSVARGGLAAGLLDTSEWFNQQLVRRLEARGWPPLGRTRSLLFRHLQAGIDRPAGLARALDITRQSMQKLLEGLEADGLVTRRPDPRDARAQLVEVTERGWAMIVDAGHILRELEDELAHRIGDDRLRALRDALASHLGTVGPDPTADSDPTVGSDRSWRDPSPLQRAAHRHVRDT